MNSNEYGNVCHNFCLYSENTLFFHPHLADMSDMLKAWEVGKNN